MANFCGTCGKEVEPGVKFCGSCGAQIDVVEGALADEQLAVADAAAAGGAGGGDAGGGSVADVGGGVGGQATADEGGKTASTGGGQAQAQQTIDKIVKMAQNTADSTSEMDPADIEKNKFIACSAYILFFIPLVACPESKFGKFHANQGLVYLILSIVGWIVVSLIRWILPGILFWLANLISLIIYLPLIGLLVLGIYNAYQGKAKDLPFIGTIRLLK